MKSKKEDRNDEIFALNSMDQKKYSCAFLAKKYKISIPTINEIILRERAKRGDKSALESALIKNKYPWLIDAQKLSTG